LAARSWPEKSEHAPGNEDSRTDPRESLLGGLTRSFVTEHGFSLVEVLVAVTIMLAVTGGVFALLNPAHSTFQAQPEQSDMQQRLRVGVDTLNKDLIMTGAGAYMGSHKGSLIYFFAPLLPFRMGAVNPDPPGTFKTDTFTLMYVPTTVAQTTIKNDMPRQSGELKVNAEPGCPTKKADGIKDPLCGFKQGMTVLIFDNTGTYDTFTVTAVQSDAMHLQHNLQDLSKRYSAADDTKITQINSFTYWLNPATSQLMRYDGYLTDTPVADNVVGLTAEYFGETQPPVLSNPGTDQSVTYGPKPPPLGGTAGEYWPAGENCTIKVVGGQQVPRLDALGAVGSGLVKLTAAQLQDGPWCSDPDNPNRWDADLLRIRKISLTIRVQAGLAALRGSDPTASLLFKNPGTATRANQTLADQEIRFDVAPRNLNFGR